MAWAHDGSDCRDQAVLAEQRAGIPSGLLLAIGQQESGRLDRTTGVLLPWPYAVNREGEGRLFAGLAEAVGFVAASLRAGRPSIDVGCFQINLKHHPNAFASLEQAFDPAANAAYAARFLRALHDRDGTWEGAVADYHSATPAVGAPYRDAVLALWRGLLPTGARSDASAFGFPVGALLAPRVAAPTTPHADQPAFSPLRMMPLSAVRGAVSISAIRPSRVEAGVRIWEPSVVAAGFAAAPGGGRAGLPRVVTPSIFR